MALSELMARKSRTFSLALSLLVAAAGFTILTANANASRLATLSTVKAHSRAVYDILVRPRDSRSPIEKRDRLVQPGFLGGTTGGISAQQWHDISALPGIEVAAPIAVVGVVTPLLEVFIDTTDLASRTHDSVWRIQKTWTLSDGTKLQANPNYVLSTPASIGAAPQPTQVPVYCSKGDEAHDITPTGKTVTTSPSIKSCWFARNDDASVGLPKHRVGDVLDYPIPMVLVGIDPDQESKLVGLDGATSGPGLSALQGTLDQPKRGIPVLVSDDISVKANVGISIEELPATAADLMTSGHHIQQLNQLPGTVVRQQDLPADQASVQLQRQLEAGLTEPGSAGLVAQYWSVSQPTFQTQPDGDLVATTVTNDLKTLWHQQSQSIFIAPAGTDLTQFRTIDAHSYQGEVSLQQGAPELAPVGSVDMTKLTGLEDVESQILAGYATAPTVGADRATTKLLGDEPVAGSTNVGALVQPPPTLIANLNSLQTLTGSSFGSPSGGAPISAVRVRVQGVTGVDQLSRERVRLAAERIRKATGLDVDVTVGSSTVDETMVQPSSSTATTAGQPAQRLRQTWVKLGVAVTIIKALDRKSLALFILVLLVSGLSIANSAVASVRSRRSQLGVLACVGWPPSALFRSVAYELGLIATASGVLAGAIALAVDHLGGPTVSLGRAATAVPVAVAVCLVAGLVPAVLAARTAPLEAVQPFVVHARQRRHVYTLIAMSRANLARVRARSLLAIGGLALATAVFTLLLAIAVGFQGAVVGSALGDAVAIQARGSDYAACAATLLLAGIGVANVIQLNIRDRATEIATLSATGWRERDLQKLFVLEGLYLGLAGGIAGAATGYAIAAFLVADLPASVAYGAMAAAAAAVMIAVAASLTAVRMVRRLHLTELLSA